MKERIRFLGISVFLLVIATLLIGGRFLLPRPAAAKNMPETLNWLRYGNDLANTRYQNVDQINPGNVANLKVAWVFHTSVTDDQADLETSPTAVNGLL